MGPAAGTRLVVFYLAHDLTGHSVHDSTDDTRETVRHTHGHCRRSGLTIVCSCRSSSNTRPPSTANPRASSRKRFVVAPDLAVVVRSYCPARRQTRSCRSCAVTADTQSLFCRVRTYGGRTCLQRTRPQLLSPPGPLTAVSVDDIRSYRPTSVREVRFGDRLAHSAGPLSHWSDSLRRMFGR